MSVNPENAPQREAKHLIILGKLRRLKEVENKAQDLLDKIRGAVAVPAARLEGKYEAVKEQTPTLAYVLNKTPEVIMETCGNMSNIIDEIESVLF